MNADTTLSPEAAAGNSESPAGAVHYRSQGRILLIGGEDALLYAPRLLPELKPQVLVIDDSDEPSVPTLYLAGRPLSIEGYLGRFRVTLGAPDNRDHELIECDLILDLSPQPQLGTELPPPGYFSPNNEPLVLDALVDTLKNLRGQFEKPRYFEYDLQLCAHVRNGVQGCTRCIDACPAEAIGSTEEGIVVNPWLCQGGGACSSVCPSGAIQYSQPRPNELQEWLRHSIADFRGQGAAPLLIIQAEEHALPESALASPRMPMTVIELASVGPDILLAALAYGASGIRFMEHAGIPDRSRRSIDQQIHIVDRLMQSLGYGEGCVGWIYSDSSQEKTQDAMPGEFVPAEFAALGDKRQRMFQAIDHLYQQAPHPVAMVRLEEGAPFGTVTVSQGLCTLCLACTSACPSGALQAAGDQPGIRFIEMNCLQCDLCTQTCPEDAISITPRLLINSEARRQPRTLFEEPAFACIVCGKPFATRRIIETVLQRLEKNPMFASEDARQRLKMCDTCRIDDLAKQEPDMLGLYPGDNHA